MFNIFKNIDFTKISFKKLIIILPSIIMICAIQQCRVKDIELSNKGFSLQMYQSSEQELKVKYNKLGEALLIQEEQLVTKNSDIEKLIKENSSLKSINKHIQYEKEIGFSNKLIAFDNNFKAKTLGEALNDTSSTDSIQYKYLVIPPFTNFTDSNKWFDVKGEITKEGIYFKKVNFRDSLTINFGSNLKKGPKGWLLRQKDSNIEIINSSPYASNFKVKNISFKDKEYFYEKTWFKLSAGIILGVVLENRLQNYFTKK